MLTVFPADKAERWRMFMGHWFVIFGRWMDARLQSKDTSRNPVFMALACEKAFPDAVDAIVNFLVPYELYRLSHSLRLERRHSILLAKHPAAFVRLADALIDPAVYPVPDDLAPFREECVRADPLVANEPGYIRLFALRRQMGA